MKTMVKTLATAGVWLSVAFMVVTLGAFQLERSCDFLPHEPKTYMLGLVAAMVVLILCSHVRTWSKDH